MINAFFNSQGGAPIICSVLFLTGDIYSIIAYFKEIVRQDSTSIGIIAVLAVMFIISLILSFLLWPKYVALLRAEQKIYFRDNIFYYESGNNVFKTEAKKISKIRQTKNFYVIKIALVRGDKELVDFVCFPQIPRRSVLKMEMKHLASLLNIEYKDSWF